MSVDRLAHRNDAPGIGLALARPFGVGDPGWPRPRWRAVSRTGHVEYGVLPAPWVAEFDPAQGWTAAGYDPKRATKMVAEDLCQLCGRPRGDEVYVLAGNPHSEQAVMSGGALCSVLCARLTAAICPRYRNQWPVRVFAVSHLGPRQRVTALDRDLDDRVDLASSSARLISIVGQAEPAHGKTTLGTRRHPHVPALSVRTG